MLNITNNALLALKSDTRYIKAHLDIYFNDIPTRLDNYFMSIDISEQNSSGSTPFGNVIYNELTVTLDNIDGSFLLTNPDSPYYNKLIAGIRVIVTYEVEIDSEHEIFETIAGGTFYTADWTSSSSSSTATLVCYDKLFQYNTERPVSLRPIKNVNIKTAFATLFKAAGIDASEYLIDEKLIDLLPAYWSSGKRFSAELADLALVAGVNVFVDKTNIIRVQGLGDTGNTPIDISDNNIILSTKDEASYTNIYDSIKIEYAKLSKTKSSTVYSNEITIPNGTQILSGLVLNECPVTDIVSIILIGASTVSVPSYTYDEVGLSVMLVNTGSECKATLVIIGQVLAYDTVSYTRQAEVLTRHNVLELSLPLSQSEEYIKRYATGVLALYGQYASSIELRIRALPMLEINDRITISSSVSKLDNIYTITGITTTFENGLIGTITVSVSKPIKSSRYAYIGPGMYIKEE